MDLQLLVQLKCERGKAMVKKKCVAMLLAGGKGSRLSSLTKELAKPAVPFGGKYRIIDFTLSNCTNSGIDTVGVLNTISTSCLKFLYWYWQCMGFRSLEWWGNCTSTLSEASEVKWYTGTASAIYQNLNYIKQYQPEYVLILSGDHIYKMNYSKMLRIPY